MIPLPTRRLAAGTALALALGVIAPGAGAETGATSSAANAESAQGFALQINDRRLDRHVTSAFVDPDEGVRIAARDLPAGAQMTLSADDADLALHRRDDQSWQIDAPAGPGVYPITVTDTAHHTTQRVNLFVMQRFDADHDAIDGYRIGHYEPKALHGREIYTPPDALMPVGQHDTDARLSEHFTIGQFLCHEQPGHWPKYVLVRPQLVAKLEAILDALHQRGIDADTLTVMSGYRTPAYNAAIGNTTSYSRHLYGGAADIYVDTNHDGRMDDLNGDGRVNRGDARWLAHLIGSLDRAKPRFVGGLSAYHATSAHGPFVHTDVRGVAARW